MRERCAVSASNSAAVLSPRIYHLPRQDRRIQRYRRYAGRVFILVVEKFGKFDTFPYFILQADVCISIVIVSGIACEKA